MARKIKLKSNYFCNRKRNACRKYTFAHFPSKNPSAPGSRWPFPYIIFSRPLNFIFLDVRCLISNSCRFSSTKFIFSHPNPYGSEEAHSVRVTFVLSPLIRMNSIGFIQDLITVLRCHCAACARGLRPLELFTCRTLQFRDVGKSIFAALVVLLQFLICLQ